MKYIKGMSLIETLISLAILSYGIIATIKMQSNMTLANQTSRQRVEATALAKSKIEYLRSTGTCDPAESGTYTPVQGSTQYTLTITCDASNKNPKVVVTWFDSRGGQDKTSGGVTTKVANNVELNTTLN